MKSALAFPLLLCLALGGPGLADTSPGPKDCPLAGAADDLRAHCQALRDAYHAALGDCIAARKAEADGRQGNSGWDNSHSNRARYLTCAAETRQALGLGAS